jgi:ABC-2 type transport system ATP-binding protein
MVNVDGNDLSRNKEKIKKITGVVPQETNLERDLSCRDNLRIQAAYYRLKDRENRIERVLKEVDLIDRIDSPVTSLSGGMKRRLLLARALLTEPSVLYMDEPSIGLDPQVRIRMWEIIRKSVSSGRKVLLTTHYIEEAEALCDRVGILSKGELIACDTPAALKSRFGEYVVEHIAPGTELLREIHATRESARNAADRFTNSGSINVTVRLINLEDVFLELTGRRIK